MRQCICIAAIFITWLFVVPPTSAEPVQRLQPSSGGNGAVGSDFTESRAATPISVSNWCMGLVDRSGNWLVRDVDHVYPFSEGVAGVLRGDTVSYIQNQGKLLFSTSAKKCSGEFHEGLCKFWSDQPDFSVGYMDKQGRVVLKTRSLACDFSEGLAVAAQQPRTENDPPGPVGYIDRSGKFAIKPVFDEAHDFHQGLAAVRIGQHWGFIDKSGKLAIPAEYERVRDFSEGLAAVERAGSREKWFYIDLAGKHAIKGYFKAAEPFKEGVAAVSTQPGYTNCILNGPNPDEWNHRYRLIDKSGEFLKPPLNSSDPFGVERTGEGIRIYTDDDKAGSLRYGYRDLSGNILVPARFEDADIFSEGLAAVKIGGKWGYIDRRGTIVIAPQFDVANRFANGCAVVGIRETQPQRNMP